MFRKLSLALAVSLALLPVDSFPLGLGDIASKSVLNDSFKADIPLTAVASSEIDDIKVQLASPPDFARAGVDRPYLLTKLRFQPMVSDTGKPVIRVTTREPVREPYLDFLVEVNWPKGRLVREFTVLLDPPVTLERTPPAVAVPVASGSAPVSRGAATPNPTAQAAGDASGVGQYGPVPRGTTLLGIAKSLNIQGASPSQVAMSLFRANPEAFINNNINRLRAGYILRIPDQEHMSRQGNREVQSQLMAETARGSAAPANKARDQLRIATPQPRDAGQGTPGKAEVPAGDLDKVKTDLMLVRESSESTRQETGELRTRIRELESQLADIHNLLKLKSDQLAQLQASQGGPVEQEKQVPAPTSGHEAIPAPTPAAEPPQAVATTPAEPAKVESTPIPSPPSSEALEPSPATATPPQPETTPVAPESPVQPSPPSPSVPVKPTPTSFSPPEPGWIEQILGDTTLLGVVGGTVVVLLSLLWLLLRHRREGVEPLDDVLVAPATLTKPSGGKSEAESLKESGGDTHRGQEDNGSFSSGFSSSDMDAPQDETGEVDPVAEADVYIAYGRYQQAENLINQAMKKQPERSELRLKLLEIYFTTRNHAGFTKLAEDLERMGVARSDPQAWQRAISMGQELIPEHHLFRGGTPAPILPGGVSGLRGGDKQSTPATLEEMDLGQPGEDELLRGLDLDLDRDFEEAPTTILTKVEPSTMLVPEIPTSSPPGGKWELPPTTPSWGQAQPKPQASRQQDGEPDELSLDLEELRRLEDVDAGGLEETIPSSRLPPAERSRLSLELELEEEPPAISLDELELENLTTQLGGNGQALADSLKPFDYGEDVETKLDLARAYIDMGDGEGARDLLQEVLREGDEQQQAVAQELLQQII